MWRFGCQTPNHPHVGNKVLVKEHQVLYISSRGRFSCAWFPTEIGNQWKHVYVCNKRGHNIRHFAHMFFHHIFFWPAFTWSFRSAYFVELESCCLLYCLFGWLVGCCLTPPVVSFRSGSMAGLDVTASAAVSSSLAASAFEAPDLDPGWVF